MAKYGHHQEKEARKPKTMWRKTIEMELIEMGLTWGQVQTVTKGKTQCKEDEPCQQFLCSVALGTVYFHY